MYTYLVFTYYFSPFHTYYSYIIQCLLKVYQYFTIYGINRVRRYVKTTE